MADLPTRDDLLTLLADAITDRSISVPAIKTLLEELRRDDDDQTATGFDALDPPDELQARRNRKTS
jgi:hypothetical protein